MYTPDLTPQDFHRLWLDNDEKKHSKSKSEKASSSESPRSAPPLSSYSSTRPGASLDNADEVQQSISQRVRQLRDIRTLGFEYLTPLGVGKTMQMVQDELELRRQLNDQMNDGAPTAENLLGEATLEQQLPLQEEGQHQYSVTEVQGAEEPEASRTEEDGPLPEAQNLELLGDLDDDVPEADEAVYDMSYNDEVEDVRTFESQYDRGFMVAEQYEADSAEHEDAQRRDSAPVAHFITPTHINGENQHRNEQQRSFESEQLPISESSFDVSNVSMNGSDLDMTIDD
ncbi:uncharacterized protein CYBJADRAFT_80293 [Cyberlindnera jadinii NRRL Y-1542]|uniref:Uncharacterized protein n=1 Tax=Cyberlindnera jadinii (strain ATCC 18201 / CBS 1600 / BCRC 20928 / JCM 3617 / NBRC 0987 / NRRL Y-1542) TaxID=983966 RepID=A0A1E4S375_CYBJN|nr:hypothetical protein CYBJADRAFT_80293 [Cyberlindnera jadinii NRRL Y-1542]ODV73913.1 hypothetical protein CYBJADRAFT_80293 [Cyberlindnera jadinii NRRL Y-1542]